MNYLLTYLHGTGVNPRPALQYGTYNKISPRQSSLIQANKLESLIRKHSPKTDQVSNI